MLLRAFRRSGCGSNDKSSSMDDWQGSFAIGALPIIANWPWTPLANPPTNRTLMATDESKANADSGCR
jgi:hypothetical protein